MHHENAFTALILRCRDGDPAALSELVERYVPHVRAAIRGKLSGALRTRFDTQDFTQNVWVSFFRLSLDRLTLPDETALIGYLCQMARHKVAEEYRHQHTQKVGLSRNQPIDVVGEPRGREPTPSAEVLARDQWDAMTAELSDRDRRMLLMLRDGYSQTAIAKEFGLSDRIVYRLLQRLQTRQDAPNSDPTDDTR